MTVQQVLPFSDFSNFLLTVLVLVVIVWPRWVVDVIPVLLYGLGRILVFLAFLATTALRLLTSIVVVHVLVILDRVDPVGSRRDLFWGVRKAGRRGRDIVGVGRPFYCFIRGLLQRCELSCDRFGFGLLGGKLWSLGGLKPQ